MQQQISLRGVAVHNLKHIDLDLPRGRLIVFCGLSGSGKSSLAFETLYAEGQRRYVETLSSYARQFLDVFEKPAAESIEGIPASIAVSQQGAAKSNRSTVGTSTEIHDFLRLLFARVGDVHCPVCGVQAIEDTPQTVSQRLTALPAGCRAMIGFAFPIGESVQEIRSAVGNLKADGFLRLIAGGTVLALDGEVAKLAEQLSAIGDQSATSLRHESPSIVIMDRIAVGRVDQKRLRDSLETAFRRSEGPCVVLVETSETSDGAPEQILDHDTAPAAGSTTVTSTVDGKPWDVWRFASDNRCVECGHELPDLEPRLFSFNHPLGACPTCEGFGDTLEVDMDKVVPDRAKSLREGAISPWTKPAYKHELDELLALADDYNIPVDIPYAKLDERSLGLIEHGVPERDFGGLDGFFVWLDRRRYKPHLRAFHNRYRSERTCADCEGTRYRAEALAVTLGGKSIAEASAFSVRDAITFFENLELSEEKAHIARTPLQQLIARLRFLSLVGLDYLSLNRAMRTLSGGEAQRTSLTSALGSSLVNVLYVFDEPTIGLHPADTRRLIDAITALRDRGNTVVVVEHEEEFIRAADHVVEIGPEAGDRGGKVTFEGTPTELQAAEGVLTGDYLSGRRNVRPRADQRRSARGWIELRGARKHNLQNLEARFPLGVFCVVTGVSGSGKSTLVQETLYPALRARLAHQPWAISACDEILGAGQVNDCVLVDQSGMARSPRSNPATYVKAFDEIRSIFAATVDAKTRNYKAGQFSFNTAGGRCDTCQGAGYLQVDMQFLGDVFMKCEACGGCRFRPEILDVKHRQRSIAEVLEMTVREAFAFFRGKTKLQAKLKTLLDVGLGYVQLGQPANTLSGGEAGRLKLASFLAGSAKHRTLFLLDEPTTGLHFADVVRLIDCLESLLAEGHSLIVIEHNMQLMQFADYVIDLGPGAADKGGRIIATGTPEEVAACTNSKTGAALAEVLNR
ncbi:MAG: excinuclease ABC subunit UvrA [Pirellulales bacterium]|nr:excinuclease ABC subunit UvrA [Pirellulales bacterium]